MDGWNHYYYEVFPDELRNFAAPRVPLHHCPHCQAPRHRRCRIDDGLVYEKSAMFRFAWYGITLMDQGLFFYFPEASKRWVQATGGYPLPVENFGFGCDRVVAPFRLLTTNDDFPDWERYVRFWLEETASQFESLSGVSPHAFFTSVTRDKDFRAGTSNNRLESYLLGTASSRFINQTGVG